MFMKRTHVSTDPLRLGSLSYPYCTATNFFTDQNNLFTWDLILLIAKKLSTTSIFFSANTKDESAATPKTKTEQNLTGSKWEWEGYRYKAFSDLCGGWINNTTTSISSIEWKTYHSLRCRKYCINQLIKQQFSQENKNKKCIQFFFCDPPIPKRTTSCTYTVHQFQCTLLNSAPNVTSFAISRTREAFGQFRPWVEAFHSENSDFLRQNPIILAIGHFLGAAIFFSFSEWVSLWDSQQAHFEPVYTVSLVTTRAISECILLGKDWTIHLWNVPGKKIKLIALISMLKFDGLAWRIQYFLSLFFPLVVQHLNIRENPAAILENKMALENATLTLKPCKDI